VWDALFAAFFLPFFLAGIRSLLHYA